MRPTTPTDSTFSSHIVSQGSFEPCGPYETWAVVVDGKYTGYCCVRTKWGWVHDSGCPTREDHHNGDTTNSDDHN